MHSRVPRVAGRGGIEAFLVLPLLEADFAQFGADRQKPDASLTLVDLKGSVAGDVAEEVDERHLVGEDGVGHGEVLEAEGSAFALDVIDKIVLEDGSLWEAAKRGADPV